MTRSMSRLVPALCLAFAAAAFAQAPAAPAGTPPPAGQQQRTRGPRPAPTNLKALPKDTTGDQVNVIMHGYERDLGVECEFCHARNPETKRNDFASDANPLKDKARVMIKMTDTINTQFVSQVNPTPASPVTCGTCHRGGEKPTVFAPPPQERAPRPATPPATTPQ